jgi:hypothetical protein
MQGNIVTAARWLGGSTVLASVILVVGVNWAITAGINRFDAAVGSHVKELGLKLRPVGEAAGQAAQPIPLPADVKERAAELLDASDNLRLAGADWERFWQIDRPQAEAVETGAVTDPEPAGRMVEEPSPPHRPR